MVDAPHATRRNLYAAVDLGTNNCRLLIAEPPKKIDEPLRVRDSFSRVVRLGEGLEANGKLSEAAMTRTIAALRICAAKIRNAGAERIRCIATEACRDASNAEAFVQQVRRKTGLRFEIISGRKEAQLAAAGCSSLFNRDANHILVFDIGGGSTEIIRLDRTRSEKFSITDIVSLPLGVARLTERHKTKTDNPNAYSAMLEDARAVLADFMQRQNNLITTLAAENTQSVQMIGAATTITTIAALQLGLPRYDRNKIDGAVLCAKEMRGVIAELRDKTHTQLAENNLIGKARAEFMLAGCAVLDVLCEHFPVAHLSVADRGLREGMLQRMISRDRENHGAQK